MWFIFLQCAKAQVPQPLPCCRLQFLKNYFSVNLCVFKIFMGWGNKNNRNTLVGSTLSDRKHELTKLRSYWCSFLSESLKSASITNGKVWILTLVIAFFQEQKFFHLHPTWTIHWPISVLWPGRGTPQRTSAVAATWSIPVTSSLTGFLRTEE